VYVGKRLQYNDEWNTAIELLHQYSRKDRRNLCLLPDFCCLAGWEHHHRINCLQDENHEKAHQLFNRKHGQSDLLLPTVLFPSEIQKLYTDSWLIGGPIGQALCKPVYFLSEVPFAVSIQSLVLIAVDRFGAVVYPLRSPLISSKLCPFFILASWIVAMAIYSPYLITMKLAEYPGGREAFAESTFRQNYFASVMVLLCFVPLVLIAILYIITYLKLKSQKGPGEQSVNARQQRQQRERNVLKMAVAIVLGFAVRLLPFTIIFFSPLVCIGQVVL